MRPSGPTAAQFIPVPQTTPTPQGAVVPARDTAKVSLRRITASVHPVCADRRRELLLVDRKVHSGQAVDAGRSRPGTGPVRQMCVLGDRGHGFAERPDHAFEADELMVARTDPGPTQEAPVLDTRTTSVLVLPPSNASTAGSGERWVGHARMLRCAAWGPRWSSSAAGARTPRSWSTACVISRTAWSSTISCCSIPVTCAARSSGGLSERILRARGWRGTFWTTADPHAALEGADFVVVQLRIGGQAARHVDETLPVGYGCLGQETVGAGGLAKALRTVPVVLELAEEMAARANPGAWLVDFTNPVGIVTQALLDEGHHAVGLCNVAIWAQTTDRPLPRRRPRRGRGRARGAQSSDLDPLGSYPGHRVVGRRRRRVRR